MASKDTKAETNQSQIDVESLFNHEEWQQQAETPGVLESIGRQLDKSLAANQTGLKAYIDDLKLTYEMLKDPDFTLERRTRVVLIIALLYIVSPIDLIPDAIPLIGLLDDILVAGFAIKQTSSELERYRAFKRASLG